MTEQGKSEQITREPEQAPGDADKPNTPAHAETRHEDFAGDDTADRFDDDPDDDKFDDAAFVKVEQDPDGGDGFTPAPGKRVDGGWKPAEHPHGQPDPGPALEDDQGARGPQARSSLPRNPPVPPELDDNPGVRRG